MKPYILVAAIAAAVLSGGYVVLAPGSEPATQPAPSAGSAPAQAEGGKPLVEVRTAALEGDALIGEAAFNAKCATCHGAHGAGKDGAGPPLIHKIYEPNHHGDMAFAVAVQNGVRAHHWPFGSMPPVEGLTRAEVAAIVAYIRTLQRANGIH